MVAQAWILYNKAKGKIGDGTIQLGSDINLMELHTSASNTSTSTLSTAGSADNEVGAGNGYATGGKSMLSVTWVTAASAGQYKFDCSDLVWTATGGTIPNIKFALIRQSTGDQAICWSRLTDNEFTLAQGNTLTVQLNALGIFTLT